MNEALLASLWGVTYEDWLGKDNVLGQSIMTRKYVREGELFPEWLLSLYNADAEMLRLGVPALRIIGATFVPMSFTVVTGFACSGAGSGLANMVGALLRQLVVLLPVAWLLARFSGVDAVWFAFWASELVAAAVAALFAKRFFGRRAETK